MLIRIEKIELANGPIRESDGSPAGPSEFRINGRRLEEEQQFIGAAAVAMVDRGNLKTTVTFSVTRVFPSPDAAEYFLLTHYAALPGGGTVWFEARGGGGVARLKLTDATLAISDHSYEGCRVTDRYTISGGAMQKG